jgi:hypothetical protein
MGASAGRKAAGQRPSSVGVGAVGFEYQQRLAWPVARLLRDAHAELRFRRSVLTDPVLEMPLGDVIASAEALGRFLAQCDGVPGCGDAQIDKIRMALRDEITRQAEWADNAGRGDLAQGFRAVLDQAPAMTATNHAPVTGQWLAGDAARLEDRFLDLWQQAPTERFFYLPAGLPEAVKTPAVIAAEQAVPIPAASPSTQSGPFRDAAAQGVILIDAQGLGALRGRCGHYAALSAKDIAVQLARMADFCAGLPRGVTLRIIDFARNGLQPSAILEGCVMLPAPGGVAMLIHPPGVAALRAQCAALVQHATLWDGDPYAAPPAGAPTA